MGYRKYANLPQQWLTLAAQILRERGDTFVTSLPEPFHAFTFKLTSSDGAGLFSIYRLDELLGSGLLLAGTNPPVDTEVTDMFIQSLRKSRWVQLSTSSPTAFSSLTTMSERPLSALVQWPSDNASNEDWKFVNTIAANFSAAFFQSRGLKK